MEVLPAPSSPKRTILHSSMGSGETKKKGEESKEGTENKKQPKTESFGYSKVAAVLIVLFWLFLVPFLLSLSPFSSFPLSMSRPNEVNICVLGEWGVGKTSLIVRLITDNFVEDYEPKLDDSWRKMMEVDGEVVLLDILDTYEEEFQSLMDQYVGQAEAFLILYSVGSFKSFENVKECLELVYRLKETGDVPIVVVGHKSDLEEEERVVSKEEGEYYVGLHEGVLFVEASAKNRENVEEAFEMVVRRHRELRKGAWEKGVEKTVEMSDPPFVHDVVVKGNSVKPAKR